MSRYGPRWPRFAAQLVAERGHCEQCQGVSDLQVHHRVPLEAGGDVFPTDPACRQTGLVVLCLSCHALEHGSRLSKGRRAWLELRMQLRRQND